ncbi:CoxG family protein [Azospirillum sp. B4]|uniref:CoxG family protein n=1 Tax=Azospirillum sp. B4 TaxID=95605 RepID=UPI00034C0818|nr:hypothetical protein [Azospirillum sp. B4]
MDITGEYLIAAPQDQVWAALNDADVLRQSVPAGYEGAISLSDLDPPNACVLHGDGQQARVRLDDAGDGLTRLTFAATIDDGAEEDTRGFFAHLAALLGTAGAANAALVADVALAEPAVDAAAIAEVVPVDPPAAGGKPKRTRKPKAAKPAENAPAAADGLVPAEAIPLVEVSPLTEAVAPTLIMAAQESAAHDQREEAAPGPVSAEDAEAQARAVEHQVRPTEAEALGSAGISLPPEPVPDGAPAPAVAPSVAAGQPGHPGLRPMIWIPILVLILLLLIVLIR